MNPFQGATIEFDRTARKLLDSYADLIEDLADRQADYHAIIDLFKSTINERETVRAHSTMFDDIHNTSTPKHDILLQSLKESVSVNIKYNKQPEFVGMMERVWAVEHPEERMPELTVDGGWRVAEDDGGFSVTAEREKLTCPLTLRPFEDPVRAECGHVFERAAIMGMATAATNFKCPVAGCHRLIKVAKLQSDAGVKRRVQQSQRKRLFP